jgi:5-methylcytosine-specific restriction endonuclease McrA
MSFSQKMIDDVWRKGNIPIPGKEGEWRKDQCGAWIRYKDYGDRDSDYGWEIDHITPESKDGESILENLRPLHWRNNAGKSDGKLVTVVTSEKNKNVIVPSKKSTK